MFKFPKEIDNIVKGLNFSIDEFGRSEDVVYLFEDKYILKISSNKDRLLNEKNKGWRCWTRTSRKVDVPACLPQL